MSRMIKAAVASAMLIGAVLGQAGGAKAGQGITVVNTNDEVTIQQVYIATAGGDDPWQPASMDHAIAPGSQSSFAASGAGCVYDIKVRFSDGDEQTFSNVDICNGDRVIAT